MSFKWPKLAKAQILPRQPHIKALPRLYQLYVGESRWHASTVSRGWSQARTGLKTATDLESQARRARLRPGWTAHPLPQAACPTHCIMSCLLQLLCQFQACEAICEHYSGLVSLHSHWPELSFQVARHQSATAVILWAMIIFSLCTLRLQRLICSG